MTILTLDKKELEKKIGKFTSDMETKITMMGTPIEDVGRDSVSVEIFPNRPDLLSLQGFSRSLLQYLGKKGLANFKVNKPGKNYVIKIDKSVKKVRPHTVCAIVKSLKLDDEKIKEIIDIQEKLHLTIGRKRKKVAMGIYPLEKIKLPIKFSAKKPESIRFIPLGASREMTGRQILSQHPAGRDYAHLLEGMSVFPIFTDADNKILSMPPIINSDETGKIDENTSDVFIECSGFNLNYLKKCLDIVVAALADMGGEVYAMKIDDVKKFVYPNLEAEKLEFNIEDINKTLGLDLTKKDIKKYLEKMGIGYSREGSKSYALIPAYRADILHWIDLAEDIAIAYGYENFKPEIPEISSIGQEDGKAVLNRKVSEILAGLGFLETSSYHLISDVMMKRCYKYDDKIEVEDSKTENFILREELISSMLKILAENIDSEYPQKIFEVGKVFFRDDKSETEIGEKTSLACFSVPSNFTQIKQVLEYLGRMLDIKFKINEGDHPCFILGRTGKILVGDRAVGFIGELHPKILKKSHIKMPVAGFELCLDDLGI